jgi:hypothetical protein
MAPSAVVSFAFGVLDLGQQSSGMKLKGSVRAHLDIETPFSQVFIGPTPHALRTRRKGRVHAVVAAEPFPDLVGLPQPPIPLSFALAGVGEAIAVAAGKQPAQPTTPSVNVDRRPVHSPRVNLKGGSAAHSRRCRERAQYDLNWKQMSWQKTLILAGVSLVLSAVVTGLVAFIADHILWE